MNPQLHYTAQQQMGYGGFTAPCRIGNWAEDEFLSVLHTVEHNKAASKGMLSSQQLASAIGSSMAEVPLDEAPTDAALRFGSTIIISAAKGGALAFNPLTQLQAEQESYAITTIAARACPRTAWTVQPVGDNPTDGIVRYGMRVSLKSHSGLFLQSQRFTMTNMACSVSTLGALRKQRVCAVPGESIDTAWVITPIDPSLVALAESEGKPVPVNTFITLQHANTKVNLCADDQLIPSKFGKESEVTGNNDTGAMKTNFGTRLAPYGVANHWAFTTAA